MEEVHYAVGDTVTIDHDSFDTPDFTFEATIRKFEESFIWVEPEEKAINEQVASATQAKLKGNTSIEVIDENHRFADVNERCSVAEHDALYFFSVEEFEDAVVAE